MIICNVLKHAKNIKRRIIKILVKVLRKVKCPFPVSEKGRGNVQPDHISHLKQLFLFLAKLT